jgi:hypothetical protein
MELRVAALRNRLCKKYDHVTPRVYLQFDVAEVKELIPSLQKQVSQIISQGEESRSFEKQTPLSSLERLNISRKIIESHDLFIRTAGSVKPYMAVAESISVSPRRDNIGGDRDMVKHGPRKGRSGIRDNTVPERTAPPGALVASPRPQQM